MARLKYFAAENHRPESSPGNICSLQQTSYARMASTLHHIALARSLPPRLLRFFAKYPPPAIITAAPTASSTHDSPLRVPDRPEAMPSPFKPHKFAITGKWHNPKFSLRRQAELVKLARQHGVEELLPHTVKGTTEKLQRREQQGLRVRGTGIGQKVKGKKWERTLKARYVQTKPPSFGCCALPLLLLITDLSSLDWRSGDKLCSTCQK